MKIAELVPPGIFLCQESEPLPDWVGLACLGLCLGIYEPGVEGDLTFVHADRHGKSEHYRMTHTDLVEELRSQLPQARSLEAADWIEKEIFWGRDILIPPTSVRIYDEFDVQGKIFRRRCAEKYTLLVRTGGWPQQLADQLCSLLKSSTNYNLEEHPQLVLLFGHITEEVVRKQLPVSMYGQIDVRLIRGRHNPQLPFRPESL
jgi:hypothetical protein